MVTKNPFYNVHVKDFRNFMKDIKKVKENITKDYIMDLMIGKYIESEDDFYKFIFKSVINFSFDRFSNLFHEELDENLIPIIFNIIFLFLTQRQKSIKKEMRKDLCTLLYYLNIDIDIYNNIIFDKLFY